jgi:hypothetical protein
LRHSVPDLGQEKLKFEWVDSHAGREAFLADGKIVLRLRREDPEEHSFIHGAYLYVSGALLFKAKRYLSPSQRQSIDLFVTSKLVASEKPSAKGVFLDQYLHPMTADAKSKVALYLDDYAVIDQSALFFPVFVQELHFLGEKVFGRRREDLVRREVNGLITFLKPIANRTIGDEGDLNYRGQYCRFGLVIIGKRIKLLAGAIGPYVRYIERELAVKSADTVYLLAGTHNRAYVDEIADRFADRYQPARRHMFRRTLRFGNRTEKARTYLLVLRRKGVELIQPSVRT